MIEQTSLQAYIEQKESGAIGRMQEIVLEAFKLNPNSTDMEIVRLLGLSENQVRPRRNELVRKGLIQQTGLRRCTITGKWVKTWG